MFTEPGEAEDKVALMRWDANTHRNDLRLSVTSFLCGDELACKWFSSSPDEVRFLTTLEDKDSIHRNIQEQKKHSEESSDRRRALSVASTEPIKPVLFTLESVHTANQSSMLSAAFKDEKAPDPLFHSIVVYFPGARKHVLRVPDGTTVSELIKICLQEDAKRTASPILVSQDPSKYEIRLHDEDGIPDEELPVLDHVAEVLEMGEVCLCTNNDLHPTLEENEPEDLALTEMEDTHPVLSNKMTMTISYPGGRTIVVIEPGMFAHHLLMKLHERKRFPLYMDEYQFKGLDDVVVAMDADLVMLRKQGVHSLTLVKKKYADDPMASSQAIDLDNNNFPENAGRNSLQDIFYFNEFTANLYEEWHVIKTNKRLKPQNRVFGIDYHKVYNKKQHNQGIHHAVPVKRSYRLIEDVLDYGFNPDDSTAFYILWKDEENKNDEVKLGYKVESGPLCDSHGSAQAVAHIMAKLKYVISRRKVY